MKNPQRTLSLALAACLVGPAVLSAQATAVPFDGPITHVKYDWATGEITPYTPPEAPAVSFANTNTSGFFAQQASPTEEWVDWGVKSAGFDGIVTSFDVGYATTAADPTVGGPGASFTVNIYAGTLGFCDPGDPGTLAGSFPLTGLPGDLTSTGAPAGGVVTVDLSATPMALADGAIGWSYGTSDLASGPLLILAPDPATGTIDAFDLYDPPGTCQGTFFFGTGSPFASFYLALTEDDAGGPPCGAPFTYGAADVSTQGAIAAISTSGGNPSASNPNFAIELTGGNPTQGSILISSVNGQASTPTPWGTILVGAPFIRHPNFTSATGTATHPLAITAGMVGQTQNWQWVIRDPGPTGAIAHHSEGLEITYCP